MRRLIRIAVVICWWAVCAHAQGTLMPALPPSFLNASGVVASGAKLCTTAAGTTNPLATYANAALSSALPNPITLSSIGIPQTGGGAVTPVYLQALAYRITLYAAGTGNTCNGVTVGTAIWTEDNIENLPVSLSPWLQANSIVYTRSPAVQVQAGQSVTVQQYGTAPEPLLIGIAARGTIASPTAIKLNDYLLSIDGRGYGTSFTTTRAQMAFTATQDWSATVQGTQIVWRLTPDGSTVLYDRMHLTNDAFVELLADPSTTSGIRFRTAGAPPVTQGSVFGFSTGDTGIELLTHSGDFLQLTDKYNLQFGSASNGGMVGPGIVLGVSTTIPASSPTGAFLIYMDPADSKLKAKGPSGTVTALALP